MWQQPRGAAGGSVAAWSKPSQIPPSKRHETRWSPRRDGRDGFKTGAIPPREHLLRGQPCENKLLGSGATRTAASAAAKGNLFRLGAGPRAPAASLTAPAGLSPRWPPHAGSCSTHTLPVALCPVAGGCLRRLERLGPWNRRVRLRSGSPAGRAPVDSIFRAAHMHDGGRQRSALIHQCVAAMVG